MANRTTKDIEILKKTWDAIEDTSEDAFKAFIKKRKMTGLPKGYHKPEIFD